MKTFTAGDINRAEREMIYPGGKGINVSLVLGNLHIPSKMLGFIAGFTGREIERLAKINGGDTDFITLDEGCSRINLKVSADDETAVNGMGPHIPEEKLQALLARSIPSKPVTPWYWPAASPAIFPMIFTNRSSNASRTAISASSSMPQATF